MSTVETMNEGELVAEMRDWLRGKERQSWKWVSHNGARISWPTFHADGTVTGDGDRLTTLRGLVTANRARHEKRSRAAKKAAATRRERDRVRLYSLVRRFLQTGTLSPSHKCALCSKQLSDPDSIARGIGNECWQHFLAAVTEQRRRQVGAA